MTPRLHQVRPVPWITSFPLPYLMAAHVVSAALTSPKPGPRIASGKVRLSSAKSLTLALERLGPWSVSCVLCRSATSIHAASRISKSITTSKRLGVFPGQASTCQSSMSPTPASLSATGGIIVRHPPNRCKAIEPAKMHAGSCLVEAIETNQILSRQVRMPVASLSLPLHIRIL